MSKRTSEAKVEAIDQKQIKLDLEQNMIFPDEIWLKIINYLSTMDLLQNLSMVCEHLRNLTLDGSAIKYLELKTLPTEQNSLDRLIEILKNSSSIRGIKIIWDDFIHDVSKWPIQNDIMNKVCSQALKSSKNLKSLKLSFKDLSAFKLHPETMKLIESRAKKLNTLN